MVSSSKHVSIPGSCKFCLVCSNACASQHHCGKHVAQRRPVLQYLCSAPYATARDVPSGDVSNTLTLLSRVTSATHRASCITGSAAACRPAACSCSDSTCRFASSSSGACMLNLLSTTPSGPATAADKPLGRPAARVDPVPLRAALRGSLLAPALPGGLSAACLLSLVLAAGPWLQAASAAAARAFILVRSSSVGRQNAHASSLPGSCCAAMMPLDVASEVARDRPVLAAAEAAVAGLAGTTSGGTTPFAAAC